MGIARGGPGRRISELEGRVGEAMRERGVARRDALAGLSDEELRDLDCVLQVARHALARQEAGGLAERALEEVVGIAEEAAAAAELAEGRAAELLAMAEAAVERMREASSRAGGGPPA
ncbi:MAG: hypothetical protein OXU86_03390 [Thaumarchaeota archaeon]|nr:hypothetical protein [Nitrososphaerota archaeon]RNJ73338.1 MAG: hypothetical protein EB832_02045 [Thaumarchaeota archaeon S14]RNJ74134.1 MAG: hypothetical protein EB833_01290 [Thaumarchaeota archaeon S13]MDD9809996.1 hypothetical protein [Nitrososphaerota archaeon]MDD9813155.1 hypothetical protein [Nitrososphaerota archaeon]